MWLNSGIRDSRINAIVVEEKHAIAAPIFDHSVDDLKRKAFVPEWIDEGERRHKPCSAEKLSDAFVDGTAPYLRLVRKLLDSRKLGDLGF
jgi:hypothetical protein